MATDSLIRRFLSWGKGREVSQGQSRGWGSYYWVPGTNDYHLKRIEGIIRQGQFAEARKDFKQAQVYYTEALQKADRLKLLLHRPQAEKQALLQRSAHWGLADLFMNQQEWDLARTHLEQGRNCKGPRNYEENHWLGKKYQTLGHGLLTAQRRPEALEFYEKAAKFKPSLDDQAHRELTQEWMSQGRSDLEAVRNYIHYLPPSEWTSSALKPLISQGCKIESQHRDEDLQDKIIVNQQILAFHPEEEWVHKNLGLGYFWQGQYDKSRHHLEQARSIRGEEAPESDLDYTFLIGKASFRAKDYQGCARELEPLLSQQVPANLRGEYELHYGLSLARLFFEPPNTATRVPKIEEIEQHLKISQDLGEISDEALYFLGRLKTVQNRSEEARALFEDAVKIAPYNPHSLMKLADIILEGGQPERHPEAKEFLRKAHILLGAEEEEQDVEVMMTLSNLLQEEGNHQEADLWFGRAQRVCPNNSMVLLNSARKLMAAAEYDQAYEVATAITSFNERISREQHFILGRCGLRLHKPAEEVEASLQKAIVLGFDGWAPYYWLGISQAHQQRYEEAKERLLLALEKSDPQTGRTLLQLGNIVLLQEDLEAGSHYFNLARKAAHQEQPWEDGDLLYQEVLYNLGRCDYRRGEKKAAAATFTELLQVNQAHLGARYFLALIAEGRHDLAACQAWLRQIIEMSGQVPEPDRPLLGAACRWLGIILCRTDEATALPEAEELLQRASDLGLRDWELVYYGGRIKALTGRLEEAYQDWRGLQDRSKVRRDLGLLNYLWGISLFEKGQYQDALQRFKEAQGLNVQEWRAEVNFRLGLDLLRQGQAEEARKALKQAAAINTGVDIYLLGQGLAAILKGARGLAEAEALFATITAEHPTQSLAAFSLGVCLYLHGGEKQEAACATFQQILENPNGLARCRDLAQLILACKDLTNGQSGELDGLLRLLARPEIRNNLPFSLKAINAKLAGKLVKLYNHEAPRKTEEYARQLGMEPFLDYCLALVHGLQGDSDKALKYLQKIYESDTRDRTVAEQYGGMLCYTAAQQLRKDNKDAALEHLDRAKKVLSGTA